MREAAVQTDISAGGGVVHKMTCEDGYVFDIFEASGSFNNDGADVDKRSRVEHCTGESSRDGDEISTGEQGTRIGEDSDGDNIGEMGPGNRVSDARNR